MFIWVWIIRDVKKLHKPFKYVLSMNTFAIFFMPINLHIEKTFVKFTRSSVHIFTIWLFSRFYKKFISVNRFSVLFTFLPVKSTKLGFFLYSILRFYWTPSEAYKGSVDWPGLIAKSAKKSSFKNRYRIYCKFNKSPFCV